MRNLIQSLQDSASLFLPGLSLQRIPARLEDSDPDEAGLLMNRCMVVSVAHLGEKKNLRQLVKPIPATHSILTVLKAGETGSV